MKENFGEIRAYLFKELRRVATLPKDDDINLYHEMYDRINAMQKIIDMLKITIDNADNELKKIDEREKKEKNEKADLPF